MIPDPYKKTARIPVILNKQDIKFFYGGDLPLIEDGTIAELIVPEYSVLDRYKLQLINKGFIKPFMEKGTTLMARVNVKEIGETDTFLKRIETDPPKVGQFAQIILDEDLGIKFQGTKDPKLMDCRCRIPALSNKEARSVNHAYTLISEKFEDHRRSHTGNVFEQVYFSADYDVWIRLKERRNYLKRLFEYELICLCRPWWYKKDSNNIKTWGCFDQKKENEFIVYNLTGKSKIVSEHYFQSEKEVIDWFNKNGYKEIKTESTSIISPPLPPYKKMVLLQISCRKPGKFLA